MDGVIAIGIGLTLRFVVDAATNHNVRVACTLVGLWEGVVLYHFLQRFPRSSDPYLGLAVRLFVDFLVTESLTRMAIVILWTGLGLVLADIAPVVWSSTGLKRFFRKQWGLPTFSLPVPNLSFWKPGAPASTRVRFYPSLSAVASSVSSVPFTPAPSLPPPPMLRNSSNSRRPPGAFPGDWSESDAESVTVLPIPPPLPMNRERPFGPVVPSHTDSDSDADSDSVVLDVPIADDLQLIPDMPDTPAPNAQTTFGFDPLDPLMTPTHTSAALPPDLQPVIEEDVTQPPLDEIQDMNPDQRMSTLMSSDTAVPPIEVQAPSDISDPVTEASVLSGGPRTAILTRAEVYRKQALAEEAEAARFKLEMTTAKREGRAKDAFVKKAEMEEAWDRAKVLHAKAEKRYFKAHNPRPTPDKIDLHGLKVPEARRRMVAAFKDVLLSSTPDSQPQLQVVVGRGKHSTSKIPVLKLAMIRAMQEEGIPTRVDPFNPGMLILTVPA